MARTIVLLLVLVEVWEGRDDDDDVVTTDGRAFSSFYRWSAYYKREHADTTMWVLIKRTLSIAISAQSPHRYVYSYFLKFISFFYKNRITLQPYDRSLDVYATAVR